MKKAQKIHIDLQDHGLISGWPKIARYLAVSVRTAKRYHYRGAMPVHRWPGGTPVIIPEMIKMWLLELDRLRAEKNIKQRKD